MLDSAGQLALRSNWFKTGFVASHSGLTGTITTPVPNVTGTSPAFVDEAGQDFHLQSGSACRDAGTPLEAAALPAHAVLHEYAKHQDETPRPMDATLDLGAYELDSGAPPGPTGTPTPTSTPTRTATTTPGPGATPTFTAAPTVSPTASPTPTRGRLRQLSR